jgi:hypothetical protein
MGIGMGAQSDIKQGQIEAVIIRADGTRENLGVVSYYNKSWFKMFLWNLKQFLIQNYNRS